MNVYMDDVRACPFPGWTVTRTVEETKRLLETGEVDHLSLDHDMGACDACTSAARHIGDQMSPATSFFHWCPHYEDGTKLARWMVETGNWSKRMPMVHSANPEGSKRMRGLFRRFWNERATYWPEYPERKLVKLTSEVT